MKINQLASKPQLIKITLDDEETIATVGEAVDFWTWDRQPLDKFMALAAMKGDNPVEIIEIVRKLILDEQGKEVIQGDIMLPTQILIKAIQKITETLGK
jgi:hypothetical protein